MEHKSLYKIWGPIGPSGLGRPRTSHQLSSGHPAFQHVAFNHRVWVVERLYFFKTIYLLAWCIFLCVVRYVFLIYVYIPFIFLAKRRPTKEDQTHWRLKRFTKFKYVTSPQGHHQSSISVPPQNPQISRRALPKNSAQSNWASKKPVGWQWVEPGWLGMTGNDWGWPNNSFGI